MSDAEATQNSEPIATLLPVYLVLDVSGSMAPHLSDLQDGIQSLIDTMATKPRVAAVVRVSLVTFHDVAECLLHMADFSHLEGIPQLSIGQGTAYSEAFHDLEKRIEPDVRELRQKYAVARPIVFFLTDGQPNTNDPWTVTHAALTNPSNNYRPKILAFGIGDAEAGTIKQVATEPGFAFIAAKGTDTGKKLADFFEAFVQSVVKSGTALSSGGEDLQVKEPDGFINLGMELMD